MSYFQNPLTHPLTGGFVYRIGGHRWPNRFNLPALFQLLATWAERARIRRQLAQLNDRQLRDIGVSPIEARREIIKPFWSE